jgi:GT2 family glycosyltransferase
MRDATVVILSKKLDLLQRAVASVLATHATLDWCQFVVVDDGLTSRPALSNGLVYIDGKKPFSFAANVNVALREIDPSRDVILMNDDIECLTPDTLTALRWAAYQRSSIGLVTPVTVRRGWQGGSAGHDDRSTDRHEIWTESEHFLIFALGYLTRDLINRVGGLDESLDGYGYDDTDYSLRAHLAGFELIVMPDVVVAHGDDAGASASFRDVANFYEILVRNQERFLHKWSPSLLGLTSEQTDRLLWFFKFSFERSPLPARARARLERVQRVAAG